MSNAFDWSVWFRVVDQPSRLELAGSAAGRFEALNAAARQAQIQPAIVHAVHHVLSEAHEGVRAASADRDALSERVSAALRSAPPPELQTSGEITVTRFTLHPDSATALAPWECAPEWQVSLSYFSQSDQVTIKQTVRGRFVGVVKTHRVTHLQSALRQCLNVTLAQREASVLTITREEIEAIVHREMGAHLRKQGVTAQTRVSAIDFDEDTKEALYESNAEGLRHWLRSQRTAPCMVTPNLGAAPVGQAPAGPQPAPVSTATPATASAPQPAPAPPTPTPPAPLDAASAEEPHQATAEPDAEAAPSADHAAEPVAEAADASPDEPDGDEPAAPDPDQPADATEEPAADQPPASPAPALPLGPGAAVNVIWSDGHLYPGTVLRATGGKYLVRMDSGSQYWLEPHDVLQKR